MAITNYATLISEVVDELDRTDIETKLPRYIAEIEADLKRRLRTLDMESTVEASLSDEDTTLPTDYLSMRGVWIDGSPDRPLRQTTPAEMIRDYDGTTGIPETYTVIGSAIRLAPPPSSATTIRMVYLAKFGGLSESNTTNWIVTDHPDIYFNGVAALACRYSRDDDGFTIYWTTYNAAVEQLKAARARDRWGGPLRRSHGIRNLWSVQA